MALEGGPAPLLAEDRALGRGEFLAGISKWVGKEGGRVGGGWMEGWVDGCVIQLLEV